MSKRNVVWWTSILTSAARSGDLNHAAWLFNAMPQRDLAPWNALITTYAHQGHLQEAIDLFHRAPSVNVITYTAMIQAYSNNSQVEESKRLFDTMGRRNAVAWTTLLVAYAQNGHPEQSLGLFQRIPFWDVFSCTAMVDIYSRNGLTEEAFRLFKGMPTRNLVTWVSILNAFALNRDFLRTKLVYELLPETSVVSSTVMILAFENMAEAKALFERLPERDIGIWNAMLAVNAESGEEQTAIQMFSLIDQEGLQPNKLTYIHTLDACSRASSLQDGRAVHRTISTELLVDTEVRTALLNLYSKCGALREAHSLFKGMASRDLICWSSMIAAYARNGHSLQSLETFHSMLQDGIHPQQITFISLLSACSHSGLRQQGITWFLAMQDDFGITPGLELFRCMVDLLCRSGHMNQAEELLSVMPFHPDTATWRTFLGACRVHRESCGEKHLDCLDPDDSATRILLLNIQTSINARMNT